jgi:hypothetical protein
VWDFVWSSRTMEKIESIRGRRKKASVAEILGEPAGPELDRRSKCAKFEAEAFALPSPNDTRLSGMVNMAIVSAVSLDGMPLDDKSCGLPVLMKVSWVHSETQKCSTITAEEFEKKNRRWNKLHYCWTPRLKILAANHLPAPFSTAVFPTTRERIGFTSNRAWKLAGSIWRLLPRSFNCRLELTITFRHAKVAGPRCRSRRQIFATEKRKQCGSSRLPSDSVSKAP